VKLLEFFSAKRWRAAAAGHTLSIGQGFGHKLPDEANNGCAFRILAADAIWSSGSASGELRFHLRGIFPETLYGGDPSLRL
jgi:hypothetical protein